MPANTTTTTRFKSFRSAPLSRRRPRRRRPRQATWTRHRQSLRHLRQREKLARRPQWLLCPLSPRRRRRTAAAVTVAVPHRRCAMSTPTLIRTSDLVIQFCHRLYRGWHRPRQRLRHRSRLQHLLVSEQHRDDTRNLEFPNVFCSLVLRLLVTSEIVAARVSSPKVRRLGPSEEPACFSTENQCQRYFEGWNTGGLSNSGLKCVRHQTLADGTRRKPRTLVTKNLWNSFWGRYRSSVIMHAHNTWIHSAMLTRIQYEQKVFSHETRRV